MKILFLRTNDGGADSRCQKEMLCLSQKYIVEFFGWDRTASASKIVAKTCKFLSKDFKCYLCGISANSGAGLKGMLFPLIRFWVKEWNFLRKEAKHYDVIHACDLDAAIPLLFLPKKTRIVYDIFDYYAESHVMPKTIENIVRKLETKFIEKSDSVIICTEEREKQISPACPQCLTVIHNSPPEIVQTGKEITVQGSNTRYRVVYVGSLVERRFLKEITEVVGSRNDVEFHLGGVGPLEQELAYQAQINDNIFFYGKLKYEDVLSLEKQCDIMTAIYDPTLVVHRYAAPNKFYEALMLKKPLIMMRDTGMDQFVEKYQLGVVMDADIHTFKEAFSDALDKMFMDKTSWDEIGEKEYKLYQERFSWEEMERRLMELYEKMQYLIESVENIGGVSSAHYNPNYVIIVSASFICSSKRSVKGL